MLAQARHHESVVVGVTFDHYENVVGLNEHPEDSFDLVGWELALEGKLALHIVSSKFSTAQVSLSVQDMAFALSTII